MSVSVTLCVIDDVKSVVDGITRLDWRQHGVEVVGTALDGQQGFELIQTCNPDIVLTDIRMPNLSGMDMMEALKARFYDGKVIFFSGYSDFEYARQAVRLGAFDYLTKPFSAQQIVDVVVRAKTEIEAARRERLDMQRKIKESLPVLRQEFLNLLLHHPANPDSLRRRWDFLQIGLAQTNLAVMVIQIDQLEGAGSTLPIEEIELIRFSLQNIAQETFGGPERAVLFRDGLYRFVVIYHPEDADADPDAGRAERCCQNIAAYTKFTVSIGVGRPVQHVHQLSESYREAVLALSYQFYTGGNVVLTYDDVAGRDPSVPRYAKEREQELGMYLRSGNTAKALETLADIFGELAAGPALPDPTNMVGVCGELAAFILRVLLEKVPYADIQAFETKFRDRDWLSAVPLKALQQELGDLCARGCEIIQGNQRSEALALVEEAMSYIRGRLHDDVTVNDCARHVHLSASYFANLFKKVSGKTFMQFLTQERMEKAKRMLLEDKQVQEIAGEVGYEDRRYFSDVFKKVTGMTPSEYKQRYTKEQ